MNNTKCKFVKDNRCTNPCAEAIECPIATYDKESSYDCCDWYASETSNPLVKQYKYERKTERVGNEINLTRPFRSFRDILEPLADLEDKVESGELGDVTTYKHYIEVLEKALKNVINEYTYDGEITVPGCEECDIAFGRPSKKCLQTQFDRLIEQAEEELKKERNS